jgi:hypothetical protein
MTLRGFADQGMGGNCFIPLKREETMNPADLAMQVEIYHDGSVVEVVPPGATKKECNDEDLGNKMAEEGEIIKKTETIRILWSNPCTWVYINRRWVYV